jgi:hypothetical protein
MKTEHVRIIYDGEALALSEIDVRTLAPALPDYATGERCAVCGVLVEMIVKFL